MADLRTLFRRYFLPSPPAHAPVEQRAITDLPWSSGGALNPPLISADRAVRLAPVFAAWRLLGDSIASLPIQGYRRLGEERQRMPSLPSLLDRPSVIGTRRDWIYRAVASLASRGNLCGFVTARDGFGFPTMVEWVNPDEVRVDDDAPNGSFARPVWYWRGRQIHVGPADPLLGDFVHIPWFTLPGKVWGLSPIAAFAATVGVGLSAQEYSQAWYAAGGVPPGTFKNTQQTVGQAEATAIKARLVNAIRTREPIVYGVDWEYNPIVVPPHEAQFVEASKLSATQIAAIYGIYPPERIGGEMGDSKTYANVEQESIDFVQFTLRPWLELLEAAFARWLPERQYVKFNADAFIRVDLAGRYASYKIAREIGLLSLDEIRTLEDRPKLPDGQGADYTPLTKPSQQPRPDPAPVAQLPRRPRAVS